MLQYLRGVRSGHLFMLALIAAGSAAPRAYPRVQDPPPVQQSATVPIEVVAIDRDGKVADSLVPANFVVTVDGRPRRVLWVRYVSRGPGSSGEAVRRGASRTEALSFAAEPARNVLVVVDEASLQRGSERAVLEAAGALIDRLGLDDRIGVIRLPMARDGRMELTTVRPEVRDALRLVVGQAAQPSIAAGGDALAQQQQAAQVSDPNRVVGDPTQATGAERERPPIEAQPIVRATDGSSEPPLGILQSLQATLNALRSSPTRKVIAVFSGGLPPAGGTALDEVAVSAVAAHAVIYAFGFQGLHDDLAAAPDLAALERLAKATGGTFTAVGRNAERSPERVVPALSACYVLGIEGAPSDGDGGRHALRVEAPRQPLTLHAPAWFVPRPDLEDLVPPAPVQSARTERGTLAPGMFLANPPTSPAGVPTARDAVASARDVELQRLLARASDYVAGYQREYSLLVAEENYVQSSRTERQQVRSDLLLVRPPGLDGWVSFRDVFEVNGVLVRDRDDRLRRLFLDKSAEAQDQLKAIKDESARYNIGQVERNINVPLFALKFLEFDNLPRFQFKRSRTQEVGGVEVSRIEYLESGRPTLTLYNREFDLPAKGWVLVDPVSGAIVGTFLEMVFDSGRQTAEFEVRYQRDAALGLWVPAEMKESYTVPRAGTMDRTVSFEARATYSKFRRFQVKTEEQIKIPK